MAEQQQAEQVELDIDDVKEQDEKKPEDIDDIEAADYLKGNEKGAFTRKDEINNKINANRFTTPTILCVIESKDEICHL